MSLIESVNDSLECWGPHPVLMESEPGRPDKVMYSRDIHQRIEELSGVLRTMGISQGSPVPLFLENSIDFTTIFLALLNIEAVPVMVKLDYRKRELDEIFSNLNPLHIISEEYHLPVIARWMKNRTVIIRKTGALSIVQSVVEEYRRWNIPDDVATINYTYRGYGYPLGSMAPHNQYTVGALAFLECLQANPGDRMLVSLPMSHIFTLIGCLVAPLFKGITAVVARTMNPRHLFSLIEKEKIAHLLSVPEVYDLLKRLYRGDEDLSSLEVFISGGSRLTPDLYQGLSETFGVEVIHGYGLTEYTPACSNRRGETRPGTIGYACNGIEYLLDDDGEMLLESPNVSRGYYRRESETRDVFTATGFRTGDLAEVEDGHLSFIGEKKQTRKLNGSIVDLVEVENLIRDFPYTDRFRLDFHEGRLTAHVALSGDQEIRKEELRRYMIDSIARYKVPVLLTGGDL